MQERVDQFIATSQETSLGYSTQVQQSQIEAFVDAGQVNFSVSSKVSLRFRRNHSGCDLTAFKALAFDQEQLFDGVKRLFVKDNMEDISLDFMGLMSFRFIVGFLVRLVRVTKEHKKTSDIFACPKGRDWLDKVVNLGQILLTI